MAKITKAAIGASYESIKEFNEIAGNLEKVDWLKIDNQIGYIWEEFTEAVEALEAGDLVELVDGACDLHVVVTGLIQLLEAKGVDMKGALRAVNENNLSKFVPINYRIQYDIAHDLTVNEKYARYVIKDSVGKIRKPSNFKAVDLLPFIPATLITNLVDTNEFEDKDSPSFGDKI